MFSVATNWSYRDKEGTPVIETMWHSCTAWDGEGICPLDGITKGAPVHLTGRIRSTRYTGKDGAERVATDVVRHIDSLGQLHGSWGGLTVIPGTDEYELLD